MFYVRPIDPALRPGVTDTSHDRYCGIIYRSPSVSRPSDSLCANTACTTPTQVLISDNHVNVKLRDGLVVGDGGGAAGAGSAAMAARGQGGVTSYRARLLPFVDGGDLVDLLARQDTVREGICLKRRDTRGRGREGRGKSDSKKA